MYVSEECTISIFTVEEKAEQAIGNSALLAFCWLPAWSVLRQ
jgi:hypothetical protein